MRLEKFIYYSTILSIFTEAARTNTGFDLKLFYLVIFINFLFLLFSGKIKYNRGLAVFHTVLLFSGFFSCVFGYNTLGYFLVQLFFLILIPVYYYSFFMLFRHRLNDMIRLYCKLSFWMAIIGLIKFPYDIIQSYGLHSIMLEPAHYCTIILPAFFLTLKNKTYPRYYPVIIFITIVLSGSSLGFIGLGLAIILYAKRVSFIKVFASLALVSMIGFLVYSSSESFRLRFDDTVEGYVSGDLSKANLSTYALLSNFFVSYQSFLSNPLFGNGVGSHVISRSIYLSNIEGIEIFEKMGMDHLNAQDAGSLFSRLMSELGLIGVFGVFYFIVKNFVFNNDKRVLENSVVSKAFLLYFFAKLFREGHYFSPEMYFFVFIYLFNKYDSLKWRENKGEASSKLDVN